MRTFTVKNESGQTFEVDHDKLHEAEADGFLPVVTNGTEEHRVSFEDMPKAEADGFKPVVKSTMSDTEAGIRGAVQGFPFLGSYADEATGALESAAGSLGLVPDKTYKQARDESREAYKEAEEFHPKSYYSGMVGVNVPIDAARAVPFLGNALGAVEGASYGLGASEADLTNPTAENISRAALDTGVGAGVGFVAPKVLGAVGTHVISPAVKGAGNVVSRVGEKFLPKASQVVDRALEKTGKVVADVPEEYVQEYLKRGGKIEARPFENIADDLVRRANDAETQLTKSKEAVQGAKESYRDTLSAAQNEFRDKKFELSNLTRDAKASLDAAYDSNVRELKSKNLYHLKDEVTDAISDLKNKVTAGSKRAYKALDNDGQSYSTIPLLRTLDEGMSRLKVKGQPISDSAISSLSSLQNLKSRLEGLNGVVSGPEAKQILQQLDHDLEASYRGNVGSFSPDADAVKKQVRYLLDSSIKEANPEYAAIMKEVAEDSSLLGLASKSFGNESALISRLNGIGTDKGRAIDTLLLKNLGKKTNRDFDTPIRSYLETRDLLKNPEAIKKSLPEHREFSLLSDQSRKLQDPALTRNFSEMPQVQEKLAGIDSAQNQLKSAEDVYDLFRNVQEGQVQGKMKALTGARDYAPTKLFERIDEQTGQPFSQEIKDRAILDSFEKPVTNGSRRTVAGTAIGGSAGSFLGPIGAAIGATGGAIAGAAADKYSGRVLRKGLDSKIAIFSRLEKAAQSSPELFNKYAGVLENASQRGGNALGVTHFLLQSIDPEYQKIMQETEDTDGDEGR